MHTLDHPVERTCLQVGHPGLPGPGKTITEKIKGAWGSLFLMSCFSDKGREHHLARSLTVASLGGGEACCRGDKHTPLYLSWHSLTTFCCYLSWGLGVCLCAEGGGVYSGGQRSKSMPALPLQDAVRLATPRKKELPRRMMHTPRGRTPV